MSGKVFETYIVDKLETWVDAIEQRGPRLGWRTRKLSHERNRRFLELAPKRGRKSLQLRIFIGRVRQEVYIAQRQNVGKIDESLRPSSRRFIDHDNIDIAEIVSAFRRIAAEQKSGLHVGRQTAFELATQRPLRKPRLAGTNGDHTFPALRIVVRLATPRLGARGLRLPEFLHTITVTRQACTAATDLARRTTLSPLPGRRETTVKVCAASESRFAGARCQRHVAKSPARHVPRSYADDAI